MQEEIKQSNGEAAVSSAVVEVKKDEKAPRSRVMPLPEKREPELEEMLKAGVHFGHQKGRWDPKMKSFIYGERGGVHIIDLQKSLEKLKLALDEVKKVVSMGGKIIFVGTKKQARGVIQEAAALTGMPYVTERWLGGTFTNFATISKRIQKLSELEEQEKEQKLGHYTKKERIHFRKEIEDFNKNMGGIKKMDKIPELMFVVGAKEEKNAIKEAQAMGVRLIALVDTNVDPEGISFPIPANDDAIGSITLITRYLTREIMENKK